MANINYLLKQIEGSNKKLNQLHKKLSRILVAEQYDWEDDHNPYCYDEYDLKRTHKEIHNLETKIAELTAKLHQENVKIAKCNIQVLALIQFLDDWKSECFTYYCKSFNIFQSEYERHRQVLHSYKQYLKDHDPCDCDCDETICRYEQEIKSFNTSWSHLQPYVSRDPSRVWILDIDKLKKDLEQEAHQKYVDIIDRTLAIVGHIVDASHLYVAENGELNGVVYGDISNATVTTISAGGWNIQKFHFRTLVHESPHS